MLRTKSLLAALLLSGAALVPPSAFGAAKGVVIASGASALWQTMALAAYNSGSCAVPKKGLVCTHYTSNANFELHDTRPGKRVKGTADAVDKGAIWIVWDNTTGPNVWAYLRADAVVGNRCFFANPVCTIQAPTGYNWASAGNQISTSLWGTDTANPPAAVQTLFTNGTGVKVNAAGTDMRPEDAEWAECRVNSKLGAGSPGFGDGLDGLGYNGNNASGTCPQYSTSNKTNGPLVGSAIISGYPGSTSAANVLAFNISGHDPFTNATVTSYSVISVGASPITFVYSRNGASGTGLNQGIGVTGLSATADQLQTLFSGTNCDASDVFGIGTNPNPIYAYVREPLAGTMAVAEAIVFRRPAQTIASDGTTKQSNGTGNVSLSQETGVGANNPVKALPCGTGGFRSRAIGTSEEVKSVQNSQTNNGVDGAGYTFFSFGNVGPIAGSQNYGYILVDGIDPIGPFNANTQKLYPNQELPACTAPCTESAFWDLNNNQLYSFPNIRNGSYGAWSLLRLVATTASKTAVTSLASVSHQYAVCSTPDYVPAVKESTACGIDPGLTVFRAHYQQCNGNGTSATCPGADGIGPAAALGTFNASNNPTGGDAGGDMGGCVGTISGGNGTFTITETNGTQLAGAATTGVIQIGIDTDVNATTGKNGTSCSNGPDRN